MAASASASSAASLAADALIDGRVVASTKENYHGRLKLIRHFYVTELHHDDLTLPVQLSQIQQFFGWLIAVLWPSHMT